MTNGAPPALSARLADLTRRFHTRAGASDAAVAAFQRAIRPQPLPAGYLDFMRYSNGAYGDTGYEGLWVRLDPLEDVLAITAGHHAPNGLLLIGATRLGDGLAVDTRSGQAQLATVSLGWWGEFDVLDPLGPTLEGALEALSSLGPLPVSHAPRSGPQPDIGYVPCPQPVANAMLAAAKVQPGETVYDLGSGDGRIVISAARKFHAWARGFELDVDLLQASRAAAAVAGVRHSASFHRADIFTVDLRPADVVTLYLLREMNARLLPQLRQMRPGSRVVTNIFDIPGLQPASVQTLEYEPGMVTTLMIWEPPF